MDDIFDAEDEAWEKEKFFSRAAEIIVLPFRQENAGPESAENCARLMRALGLPHFLAPGFINENGSEPAPCAILFASNRSCRYNGPFFVEMLGLILPFIPDKLAFMQKFVAAEKESFKNKPLNFHLSMLTLEDGKPRIELLNKAWRVRKKAEIILGTISHHCPVALSLAGQEESPRIIAPQDDEETRYALYRDAKGFILSFFANEPEEKGCQAEPQGATGPWPEDVNGLRYAVNLEEEGEAAKAAKTLVMRVLQDAGLCLGLPPSDTVIAAHEEGDENAEFYWEISRALAFLPGVSGAALFRPGGKFSPKGFPNALKPLSGINGLATLLAVENGVRHNMADFAKYLAMAARAANTAPDLGEHWQPPLPPALPRLFQMQGCLRACLPFRLETASSFPIGDLKSVGCDSPSIRARMGRDAYRIFYPSNISAVIGPDEFVFLMLKYARMQALPFLLLQDGEGMVYKIGTDKKHDDFGAVEIIANGPLYDVGWQEKLLRELSGHDWRFLAGTLQDRPQPFLGGTIRGMERSRALKYLHGESAKMRRKPSMPGAPGIKLHNKVGCPWQRLLQGPESVNPASLFDDLVLFAELNRHDDAFIARISEELCNRGCLVLLCRAKAGRFLLAPVAMPEESAIGILLWLQGEMTGELIGLSLGNKPRYIPDDPITVERILVSPKIKRTLCV